VLQQAALQQQCTIGLRQINSHRSLILSQTIPRKRFFAEAGGHILADLKTASTD